MGQEWTMERKRMPNSNVACVLDGYFSNRILANSWAKAGNFEVDSKKFPGKKVRFFPLEAGLDYADMTLRKSHKHALDPAKALGWYARNDRFTKTVMSRLVTKQWPGGEAMYEAMERTGKNWDAVSIDGSGWAYLTLDDDLGIEQDPGFEEDELIMAAEEDAAEEKPDSGRRTSSGSKGKGKGKDKSKIKGKFAASQASKQGVKKKPKYSRVGAMATQWPARRGGGKLCPTFNMTGCKKGKSCAKGDHVCAYIVKDDGTICGKSNCWFTKHKE